MRDPLLTAALALSLALGLAGCGARMCDPGQVGEPWRPYEQFLPDDTVECGPNRLQGSFNLTPAAKP